MKTEGHHSSERTLSRGKKCVFFIVMIFLPFLLCFLCFEIYIRATRDHIDLYVLTGRIVGPNPMAEWAHLDAFSAYTAKPGRYDKAKTVNRWGFISTPDLPLEKPSDTLRIVFLGGSSTAGTGLNLPDEHTWPWQLIERLRRESGRNIDFINAALGGYCSFESYGRLWSRLRFFQPDIVILYHGWNEMYYFEDADNIVTWKTLPDGSWSFKQTPTPITYFSPHPIDPLLRWSQGLSHIRLRCASISGEIGTAKSLKSDFNKKGLDVWRSNLRLIRNTCQSIGAKLFVVKQATLIVPDLPESDRRRCSCYLHGFDLNAHIKAYRDIYKVIDEEIPQEFIIDPTDLSGQSELFYDHVHLNPEGSRALADNLASRLLPLLQ